MDDAYQNVEFQRPGNEGGNGTQGRAERARVRRGEGERLDRVSFLVLAHLVCSSQHEHSDRDSDPVCLRGNPDGNSTSYRTALFK